MSNTVIKVENISKQYRLGSVSTGTISHDVNRWWHKVRGKEDPYQRIGETNDRTVKGTSDYIWALQDIDFEVKQGEVLGIIGRNGAGKSTLLKILSRTTAPTSGRVHMKGKIASLLEVGTGFHPELTGRENVYLNGAILGMTKREITRKFDEIVDFAGVERYIDTPVKRYSSGMYVRLAFAVAAFLEPEILIVDEVLAVGDAEFQKRCLGRMSELNRNEGRTILFVSHNMAAMQKICNKGMLMQNGKLVSIGSMKRVIDTYLEHGFSKASERTFEPDEDRLASITKIVITDESGIPISEAPVGRNWIIKVYFRIHQPVENFISAVGIINSSDIPINTSWQEPLSLKPDDYCTEFKQNVIIFATGNYRIMAGLSIGLKTIQYLEDALDINIVPIVEEAEETVVKYDSSVGVVLNQLAMKTYPL
jgi:lipopolysaccharide transport system ATP-binding protein